MASDAGAKNVPAGDGFAWLPIPRRSSSMCDGISMGDCEGVVGESVGNDSSGPEKMVLCDLESRVDIVPTERRSSSSLWPRLRAGTETVVNIIVTLLVVGVTLYLGASPAYETGASAPLAD